MQTATTKQVREIIKNNFGIVGARTDKASEDNMRLMMFFKGGIDDDFCEKVTRVFRGKGFDNRIKVTSGCYLRIKAVFA